MADFSWEPGFNGFQKNVGKKKLQENLNYSERKETPGKYSNRELRPVRSRLIFILKALKSACFIN